MNTKIKIALLASMAVVGGIFYYKKQIVLPDGTQIGPAKKIIGGALFGAAFASFFIVSYEMIKK